jgi:thiamine biosynthesis protein ThiS
MSRTATTGVAREIAVMVNDEPRTCEAGATAADLVAALGLGARPIAVEINRAVVPRARLAGHRLEDGDRLEIVTLVGGG